LADTLYSDIWAIGVITYFLLCGYTPFDRESNLEEMQAILVADYSFTPIEYWRNVSKTARDFINRCLTIDPRQRMTSHQALQHPWIKSNDPTSPDTVQADGVGEDLLPTVKKNFNARRTLHKAIDTVRAINKLREGGGLMMGHMDGAMSMDPKPKPEMVNGSKVMNDQGQPMEGIAQGGGSGQLQDPNRPKSPQPPPPTTANSNNHNNNNYGGGNGDAMEIDSRSNAHGQTEEQIRRQEQKVMDTVSGMWSQKR